MVPSFQMRRQIGRVFQALSRAGDFGCPVQGEGVVRVAAGDERRRRRNSFFARLRFLVGKPPNDQRPIMWLSGMCRWGWSVGFVGSEPPERSL